MSFIIIKIEKKIYSKIYKPASTRSLLNNSFQLHNRYSNNPIFAGKTVVFGAYVQFIDFGVIFVADDAEWISGGEGQSWWGYVNGITYTII